jgi:hypothetical protein
MWRVQKWLLCIRRPRNVSKFAMPCTLPLTRSATWLTILSRTLSRLLFCRREWSAQR